MMHVQNVSFEYPGLRALDQISLHVKSGQITALVGPNGAGKSTLLRILAVLQQPLCGSVKLDGKDVFASPRQTHQQIGFLPDFFGLYDALTVQQCLCYYALAHKVPAQDVASAIDRAASLLQLETRMQQKAASLSRGLRQRLAIAQAIVHQPRLLLLDEPASGLDPEARHALSEVFLRLKREGVTLLVSSHILSELEAYCDDMIVLREGRVVEHEQGPVHAVDSISMRMQLTPHNEEQHQHYIGQLRTISGVGDLRNEEGFIYFSFNDDAMAQQQLLRQLIEMNIPVLSFSSHRHSLQDAYLATRREA